jgi:hypothetical protein
VDLPSLAAVLSGKKARKPVHTHALIRAAAAKHRVPAVFVKSIAGEPGN